jgi:signal transduction histidine kinase
MKEVMSHILHSKKTVVSMIGTVLLVILLAIVSVVSYLPLKNHFISTNLVTTSYLESEDFIYTLADLTNYLQESTYKNPGTSYYRDISNLKYYVTNKTSGDILTNIPNVSKEILNQLTESSLFFLQMDLSSGKVTQIQTDSDSNFNKEDFVYRYNDYYNLHLSNLQTASEVTPNETPSLNAAELEIRYMLSDDVLTTNDLISRNINSFILSSCLMLILIIGIIGTLALVIIAFSIPYSYQQRISICRLYNKLFLEFKVLGCVGVLFGVFALLASFMNRSTNRFVNESFGDILYHTTPTFYLIGIPIVFILYLLIYINIVYLKSIYYTGFKQGFIKNSAAGRLTCYFFGTLKNFFLRLFSIDLRQDFTRKLLFLIVLNFLALTFMAALWPFGFLLGIGYSIALLYYILKLLKEIKSLYEASNKLAFGELNIVFNEDMGLLDPIAKNLNHIREGFKIAVDKEMKSQSMKAELISSVSHDLKTPLTSIITYVDLLKTENLEDSKRQEYVAILDNKSKRLQILIEDLFEASKATSGNIELHLEAVNIAALLKQTLGELQEKITQSGLQIRTSFPDHKITCQLDGQRTYRIFENLIGNILKYSLPHSRVYIDILDNDTEVTITFKNISAYEMNFDAGEITERFTRGDKSRHTEGSGLGLSIAKSLTVLQQGHLEISIDGDLFKVILTFNKLLH